MEHEDSMSFERIQAMYGGKYIAILNNRIVAYGVTFSETQNRVMRMRIPYKENLSFRYIQPKRLNVLFDE